MNKIATPKRIPELENLFEINRDNAKIRQFRQDIEDYERVAFCPVERSETSPATERWGGRFFACAPLVCSRKNTEVSFYFCSIKSKGTNRLIEVNYASLRSVNLQMLNQTFISQTEDTR